MSNSQSAAAAPFTPYAQTVVLDSHAHRALAFPANQADFRFAAALNTVPLLAQELRQAAAHYPVVFLRGNDDVPMLAALVGLGDGGNRFVDADGQWRRGVYVPAWVRRYPLVSIRRDDGGDNVVGIDAACSWFTSPGSEALFDVEGNPTPRLQAARAYCAEFDAAAVVTQAFTQATAAAGLLEESNLRIDLPGVEPRTIDGFSVVREADLAVLDDATVLDFHRKGYLGLIHAHLMSLGNVAHLLVSVDAGQPATAAARSSARKSRAAKKS